MLGKDLFGSDPVTAVTRAVAYRGTVFIAQKIGQLLGQDPFQDPVGLSRAAHR